MKRRAFGWVLVLLGSLFCGITAAAADTTCTFTPSPSDWQLRGRVYYRLVMDRTWLFVPTGHVQIQAIDAAFESPGKVRVTLNGAIGGVTLFADQDLHSPKGTEPQYSVTPNKLDEWFFADFSSSSTTRVDVIDTPTAGAQRTVTWMVSSQCSSTAVLRVAPESPFGSSGLVGGPFEPASQSYGLSNGGSSSLGYTVAISYYNPGAGGWLSLSAASGTLAPGATGSVVAAVNAVAAGLAAGTYTATIEFRTAGSSPQTIARTVTLTIQPGPVQPPVLSGRITTADGAPLEGVRMDGLPSVQWTDANGQYSVYAGTGWAGTVRPFKAGFSFTPPSRTYPALTTGMAGQDYTAAAQTYTLSGQVTLNGAGLPGVTLAGLPGNPVTDGGGNYSVSVPFHWAGMVTPSAPGYAFTPDSVIYAAIGMNRVEESYTAVQQTVSVSGRVTLGSAGLGGVWLDGLPGSVLTAADGTYAAAVPYGWSGTVAPAMNGYVFLPPSRDYTALVADASGQGFTASQAPPGSGHLWIVSTSAELTHATVFSLAGDLILVKSGTYLGANLASLGAGVAVVSEAGADQTILEVNQFVVNMSNVVIDGFTFRTTGSFEPIHITGSSNVHFRNCKFLAPAGAFGVRITSAQNVLLETSVFSGPAGVLLRSGTSTGTLTLRNDLFTGSTTPVVGGSNPSLQVIFENNVFRGSLGTAVELSSVGSVLSRNNIFDHNSKGMRLSSISGTVQLTQDTLVGNGTGYEASGTISMVIFNTILQGNTRGIDGGGNATISVHHLLHWQDTSWLFGSAHYILDETKIWEADPKFVNAAAGDYRLASGSPARGVGQGGVDLGAYGGALGSSWQSPPGLPQPAPALLSIEISGPDQADPGDTVFLTAKAHYENGYSSPNSTYTGVAQWSSSDPSVLESSGAGRFLALRPGQAAAAAHSGNVTGSFPLTVLASDLSLTVADTVDPVAAGGSLTYQISCANGGPGLARNVQITVQYDARTSFATASPAPTTGTNRWSLGDLQPGQSIEIVVTLTVAQGTAGATLSVSAGATADFATASASETTGVLGTPDLRIQAGLAPASVHPGGNLTATLTFSNAGSAPARDVIVQAAYPSGAIFHSASPAPNSGNGTWFVGTLAPGEQRVIAVDLAAALSASGTLVITAEVRGSDPDPSPGDNQAAAAAPVVPVAGVRVTAIDAPDPVVSGHPLTYSITVTNAGPSVASAVTLTAQLPNGLSLVSALPSVGSCGGASPVVCLLGSVAAGASVNIQISGSPSTAGALQMTSTALANEEDPNPNDNLVTVTTNVLAAPTGLQFYALQPCRILDTRATTALASGVFRSIPVTGLCGVPASAKAVSLNVTAVSPSGTGDIALWPADLPQSAARAIYFSGGLTRASNAVLALATDGGGDLAARSSVAGSGTVHLILDVNGYFE